jgi:peptidoglycan biosynthesis protein MviN/MurJ (putative lipid II flippase)
MAARARRSLHLALYRVWGVPGIAAATSVVNVVGFCALYVLLQRRVGLLGTRRTLVVGVLTLAAAAAGAALAWLVVAGGAALLGTGFAARVVEVGAATCAGGGLYLGMIGRMRLVAPGTVGRLLRSRGRRDGAR